MRATAIQIPGFDRSPVTSDHSIYYAERAVEKFQWPVDAAAPTRFRKLTTNDQLLADDKKICIYDLSLNGNLNATEHPDTESGELIYKLIIVVEKVAVVRGANFLKNKENEPTTFFYKEKLHEEFAGKKVKANVQYKGDERGGLFWIKKIEIIN